MPNINLSILNQKATPSFYADTLANRPAPSYVGRIFVSTDTLDLYRDTGTAWVLLSPSSTGTITGSGAAGQVTIFSGASSITGTNNLFWDTSNLHLGINTNTPGASLDVHSATGIVAQLNVTTATNNTELAFQNSGTGKWRIGNSYNAGSNDFQVYDVVNSLQRFSVKNTGQTFVGTQTSSSGLLVVNSATGDNHIVVIGATAPSIRINNSGTGATRQIGLGLATSSNNFIQGTTGGELCLFNSSTTPSPILFGIYNGVNTQEAARVSTSFNFLIGSSVDSGGGEKLQVTGNAKITGTLSATTISKIGGSSTTLLATDGTTISAGTGITISAGSISASGGGGSATIPTFTFVTTNNLNPAYYFDSYLLQYNINGNNVTGYTKTGALTINSSNYAQISSFTSDVEVLTNFATNFQNATSLSLPNLVAIGNQFNPAAPLVTDLGASFPSLQRVGGNFSVSSSFNILNLNFTSLIYCGALSLNNNNATVVTSISFPNLVSVGTSINILNQSAVTTFNFNSLQNVFSNIAIQSLTSLTAISFSSLAIVNNNGNAGGIAVSSCTALTSFILPSIQRVYSSGGATISFSSGTPNLQIFAFGSGLKQIGNTSGNVIFSSCALVQSSVDGILVSLAALDGTNGTTTFNNRTVTITGTSATPSATGLAAKATLVARGCTVTTN